MKIKTRDLIGAALDWAVASCEGLPIRRDPMGFGSQSPGGYWIWSDSYPPQPAYMQIGRKYSPSTLWEQGGPIIDREKIVTDFDRTYDWDQPWRCAVSINPYNRYEGETNLIAAMRCYVDSKIGDEVDVPDKL